MKTMKYFSAVWCGPCKAFKPIMQEIANDGYQVAFMDIDVHKDLAEEYNVRSVPTLVIEDMVNNELVEVDRIVGTSSKETVLSMLS